MTQPKDSQALKGKSGLRRLINAFGYSREGIAAASASEEAFRQECWLAIIGIPLAFILPVPLLHSLALAAAILFLLIVEILNSAIEAAIAEARAEGKPVLLDFWGPACKACDQMEASTFTEPAVQEELKRFEVLKVRMDLADKAIRPTQERFGIQGLPTFIVIE